MIKVYPIKPVPKPRQTRSDKWKQRPAVMRYRAFKDEIKAHGVTLPDSGACVTFAIPMPKSWSKKKREQMRGEPHQQRGDIDNYVKSLLDAIFDEDSRVWHIEARKIWAVNGKIIIGKSGGK